MLVDNATQLKVDGATASLNVKGKVTIKGENNTAVTEALIIQNDGKLNIIDP